MSFSNTRLLAGLVSTIINLVACTKCDFLENHEACIIASSIYTPRLEVISQAIDTILEGIPGENIRLENELKDWSIEFIDYQIPCDFGVCDGESVLDKKEMQLVGRECISDTSIAHEFVHLYQWYHYKIVDKLHKDKYFFSDGCLGKYIDGKEFLDCYTSSLEYFLMTSIAKKDLDNCK